MQRKLCPIAHGKGSWIFRSGLWIWIMFNVGSVSRYIGQILALYQPSVDWYRADMLADSQSSGVKYQLSVGLVLVNTSADMCQSCNGQHINQYLTTTQSTFDR